MLLKALEDKAFFAVGADTPTLANFQLIAGTNKDLRQEVALGNFREDLWARLNTWTFFCQSLVKGVKTLPQILTLSWRVLPPCINKISVLPMTLTSIIWHLPKVMKRFGKAIFVI